MLYRIWASEYLCISPPGSPTARAVGCCAFSTSKVQLFLGVELRTYAIVGYEIVEHTFVVFCCGFVSVSNHSARVAAQKRPQRNDWQGGFSRRSWSELDSTNPPRPPDCLSPDPLPRVVWGAPARPCQACLLSPVLDCRNVGMHGLVSPDFSPRKASTMLEPCPPAIACSHHDGCMAKHRPLFSALPSRGAKCRPVDRCSQSAIVHAG